MRFYKNLAAVTLITAIFLAPSGALAEEEGPYAKFIKGLAGTACFAGGFYFIVDSFRLETLRHDVDFARKILLKELNGNAPNRNALPPWADEILKEQHAKFYKKDIKSAVEKLIARLKAADSRGLLNEEGKSLLDKLSKSLTTGLKPEDLKTALKDSPKLTPPSVGNVRFLLGGVLKLVGLVIVGEAFSSSIATGATLPPSLPEEYNTFYCDIDKIRFAIHSNLELKSDKDLLAIRFDPELTTDSPIYYIVKGNIDGILAERCSSPSTVKKFKKKVWTLDAIADLYEEYLQNEENGINEKMRELAGEICLENERLTNP